MFGEMETKTFGQTETDIPVKIGIEASVQRRHRCSRTGTETLGEMEAKIQYNGDQDFW